MGLLEKLFNSKKSKSEVTRADSVVTHEEEAAGAKKLSEYKSVKDLGAGAEGFVKEMVHVPTGKHYAVKFINRVGDRRPKEMSLLQGLHHPNVVELVDSFQTKSHFGLVFELATGGELLERMVKQRGHYTEKDAAAISATIFNAMAYVHSKDLVHRDLKTANLVFKNNDPLSELLIVDFGLSRSTVDETAPVATTAPAATENLPRAKPQALMQTFRPYHGKPLDIFGLGSITYKLLSGVNPYWASPPHELDKHRKIGKWTFHRCFANVSEEAHDFIKKRLEVDPEKRMTAEEALDHPWIKNFCPPEYLESLKQLNRDLAEFDKLGLEEAEREYVRAIKDQDRTIYQVVGQEALPERPWLKEEPTSNLTLKGKKVGVLELASAIAPEDGGVNLMPELTAGLENMSVAKA